MDKKQYPQPEDSGIPPLDGNPPEPVDFPVPEAEDGANVPGFFVPEMVSPEEALPPEESPVPELTESSKPVLPQEPEDLPSEEPSVPEPAESSEPVLPREPEDLSPDSPENLSQNTPVEEPEETSFHGQPEPSVMDQPSQETKPARDGAAFMAQIPEVEDAAPQEEGTLEDPLLTLPHTGQELTADDQALDFQGMLGHGEEEPPFDPAILESRAFQEEVPQPSEEDLTDQEYRDNGQEFDAMFDAPPAQAAIPAHNRPPRKGRPKRKKGEGFLGIPNILVTFVWLALILAIGVTAGRMLWVCAAEVLAFGKPDQVVTVTIYESDTMDDITDKLYDAGLIRYKSLFQLYATISNAEEDIEPGIYDLNTRYDYHALVNFMTPRSSREVITLTIPEGYTCRQIFQLLEEKRICTAQDISAYAASGELEAYWFLENVQRGDSYCLEGFLFPDTYEFYRNSTPREALEKMLDNFDYRFSEEMRSQIDSLNNHLAELMRDNGRSEEYISQNQFTVREVTIVASLIEKETANSEESPTIASVIYNRLFNWGDTPAYLNIDASIIYALDGKTDLTAEDLRVDSPYNTYTNTGLTPTPISNPGLASLEAALNPATTDYYFYVLNPSTGTHQFSTTQEEHEAYRAQFAEERVG